MVNVAKVEELRASFKEMVNVNFERDCQNLEIVKFMEEDKVDLVKMCVMKIKNIVLSSIPEGVAIPGISIFQKYVGEGEITGITVTVSNRISDTKKFKFRHIANRGNVIESLKRFFTDVYETLMVDSLMEVNIKRINEVMEAVCKDAGLSYKVKVVSPLEYEGKKIAMMTDEEIQFVVSRDRIFNLDDVLVLRDVDSVVTEEMIEYAFNHEIEEVSEAQTPEQLVEKHGGALMMYVCDLSKRTRPMTYIKKITNKNIMGNRNKCDEVLYFLKGDVFALVARRDGNMEVVLSPFNTKTFRKVDVDVLAEIA